MKPIKLHVVNNLLLLFVLSFFLPMTGYGSAFSILSGWMGWNSPSNKAAGKISKIVLARNAPPLHFSYEIDKTSSDFVQPEKNQIYTRWGGCKNDSLRICFRKAGKVFEGGYSYPPTISGSTVEGVALDVQMGEVTPDGGGWQSVASVYLTGKGTSRLTITGAGDDGWRIAADCSSLDSDYSSVANRSDKPSVDLIAPTELVLEKSNNAEGNDLPHSRRLLPDISKTTQQNNLPSDHDDLLTGSGGGSYDDHDDSFKRRPGGNGRPPLLSFEVMSRMLEIAVNVPGTDGQPRDVKKLILRPQIILVVWRGWERQEIPVTSQMWGSIKLAGLDRDPSLFLALAESDPDKLKETLENYLNKHSILADVRNYHNENFNLDPKAGNARLLSVSVFPGSCPSGVGCSGGEKDVDTAMNELSLNAPSGYTYNNYGQLIKNSGNKGGGGGGSGNPEINSCKLCGNAQVKFNGLCASCLRDKQKAAKKKASTHSSLSTAMEDKEIEVSTPEHTDLRAISVNEWIKNLSYKNQSSFFHKSTDYKKPELYQLLSDSLRSKEDLLQKFQVKWQEFLRGQMSIVTLILSVGRLATKNGMDSAKEVYRIVSTLAVYREEFETANSLKNNKQNHLRIELTRRLESDNHSLEDVEYSSISKPSKTELVAYIYAKFRDAKALLMDDFMPSEYEVIEALDKMAFEIFLLYDFGLPPGEPDNQGETIPWGMEPYAFISGDNDRSIRSVGRTAPLQGVVSAIAGYNSGSPTKKQNVATMLTALAVLEPIVAQQAKDSLAGLQKSQRDQLSEFGQAAVKSLVTVLNQNPEQKAKFIDYMLMFFGQVPEGFIPAPASQTVGAVGGYPSAAVQVNQPTMMLGTRFESAGDRIVSEEDIANIAEDLSINWKSVGRRLGVKNNKIDEIDLENRRTSDKAHNVLVTWKQQKGYSATISMLQEALKKSGRTDLVEKLAPPVRKPAAVSKSNVLIEGNTGTVIHGDNLNIKVVTDKRSGTQ